MRRTHLVGLYGVGASVAAFAGILLGSGRYVAVIALACALLIPIGLMRASGFQAAVAFAFLAPSTGLRVGVFTLADLALAAAVVPAVFALTRGRTLPWAAWFPALAVLGVSGAVVLTLGTLQVTPVIIFVGSMLLVPVTLAHHGRSEEAIRWLAGAFVLGVAVNGVAGVYDILVPGPAFASITSGTEFGGDLRPAGLTTHSNQLGLLSGLATPLALFFVQRATGTRRLLWIAAGVTLVMGAAASGSRGGILAVVGGASIWVVLSGRRPVWRAVLTTAAAAGCYLLVTALGLTVGLERLLVGSTAINSASAAQSNAERDYRASVALDQFAQNYLTGVGFSSGTAHNFYLEVARSGGAIVLALVIIGILGTLLTAWRTRNSVAIASAVFASAAVWAVFAIQHNASTARFIWIPSGLAAACWVAARTTRTECAEVAPELSSIADS